MADVDVARCVSPVPWPFLAAPVIVTVLVMIWTLVVSPHSQYGDNWAVYPVLLAFLLVLGLHGMLVVRSPLRLAMVVYALLHLAFWVPFGIWCMMRISKDSL